MNFPNPKYGNTVLDSCVLGTPGVEHDSAAKILELAGEGKISVITTHGVIDEIATSSTPQHVKAIAASLIFTLKVGRNSEELRKYERIHKEMTGNGKPEKYAADADHIFEAGKYGGYFVTNDERILKKRESLNRLSGAFIVRPSEWQQIFSKF
jgi:hypothetical protein